MRRSFRDFTVDTGDYYFYRHAYEAETADLISIRDGA